MVFDECLAVILFRKIHINTGFSGLLRLKNGYKGIFSRRLRIQTLVFMIKLRLNLLNKESLAVGSEFSCLMAIGGVAGVATSGLVPPLGG